MTKTYHLLTLTMVSTSLLTTLTHAEKRSYVWTYEYKTMKTGEAELEMYTTLSAPDFNKRENTTTTELLYELEVGMTNRLDFSIYQSFSQQPGGTLTYNGFKLRSRYRIGEKGIYIMDPLIYAEYKGKPDLSKHTLEGKLIMAKDIGKLNIALNPIWEFETENGKTETEWEYASGLSYRLSTRNRIGFELKGSESGHYAGPVISHGSEKIWVALGTLFGYTDFESGKDQFLVRLILGIFP